MFKRLMPASNIKTEILNDTIILTGSVRNPIESQRAADLEQIPPDVDQAR
jgi:pilus assembly protein CpaC